MSLDALAQSSNPASMSRADLGRSTNSFAQQLAETLETYLGPSGAGTRLEIDIMPAQGGNLGGTRQFIVTVKDPAPVASSLFSPETPPAAAASQAAVEEEPAPTNEIDAYWATQPKEVRVLRTIDDFEERGTMARKLADQGFTIDYAIMVLRWDPYMTIKGRLEEGYTWVPSIKQNGLPVAPGITFPGLPSYDPHNPPPGSVILSLDFARGLEHTSLGARSPQLVDRG
jgi:hypothetical protein